MKPVTIFLQCLLILIVLLFRSGTAQIVKIDGVYFRGNHKLHESASSINHTVAGKITASDSLVAIKPDFLINSLDGEYGASQDNVIGASDSSGNVVLAWTDGRSGTKDIYVQFFNSNGEKSGGNIKANDFQIDGNNSPFVAANKKGDFIVAWSDEIANSYGQKFNNKGEKIGSNFQINSYSYFNSMEPCIAVEDDGSFMAMWLAENNDKYNAYVRFFNNDASPKSPEFQVNNIEHNVSSIGQGRRVAVDGNGNYVIVWSSYAGNAKSDIYLQMLNREGGFINSNILVSNLNDGRNKYFPEVAATYDGHYFIIWEMENTGSSNTGNGGRIYSDSSFVTEQMEFSKYFGWNPISIATDRDSLFLIQYYQGTAQLFAASGEKIGNETRIKFNETDTLEYYEPDITDITDGKFYSSKSMIRKSDVDIYSRRFNLEFNPAGDFLKINDDSASSWQKNPVVHFNSEGGSIVLWEDHRNGRSDLYAQVYDAEFNPTAGNLKISRFSTDNWYIDDKAVCSLSDGTFIVAFTGSEYYSYQSNVYIQKISPDGKLAGDVFKFTENTENYQVKVNTNSNDEFMLCWYNYSNVYANKFDKNLTGLSSHVLLHNKSRYLFDASVDKDLNVFTVWGSNYYDSDDHNIYGVIYNNSENKVSEPFTTGLNNTYVYNLSCAIDGSDYAVIASGSRINILRSYLVNNSYENYNLSFYNYNQAKTHVVRFLNGKLFTTFHTGMDVMGYFIDDNKDEVQKYNLHSYEFIGSFDEYNQNNSSSFFNDKLFFTYERSGFGTTGFDVMGSVMQLKNINFKNEAYYRTANDDYLFNNFPNPFNGKTIIPYKLLSPYHVKLTLYDILGREVKVIVDEFQEKGFYETELDASGLSSGVYIYKLDAFKTYVKKMIILK